MTREILPSADSTPSTSWRPAKTELLNDGQWHHIKRHYHMTERELEIARLVCAGLSNDDIALKAKIAPGTVKTHLRNIYRKTWVSTKIAMLLRFLDDASHLP